MARILDLDSKSAVTIFSLVTIPHDASRQEVGLTDLENYISQAIWKTFDHCRREAAERLQVDEVDLLLTDARVIEIRIDGHSVINPHGFTGKEIDVILALTMVRRDKFVEEADIILEGGSVRAHLLAKNEELGDALYVEIKDNTTTIFQIGSDRISYLHEFGWGENHLLDLLKEELALKDEASAKGVHRLYAEDNLSERAGKTIDRIFYNAFTRFVKEGVEAMRFASAAKKLPPIYLKSFFPLPTSVYRKRFNAYGTQIRFLPPAADYAIENFVNDSIHSVYNELNHLAKRRIKWLMPTASDSR